MAGESRSLLVIVITGEVKDADGEPLPGVTGRPERDFFGMRDGYGLGSSDWKLQNKRRWCYFSGLSG